MGYAFSPPEMAAIEHTTRCNLKCRTCARYYWKVEPLDMVPEVVRRVGEQILPRVRSVGLAGHGEPLMGRHFFDLLDAAVRLDKEVGFITNGVLLDDDALRRVYRPGVSMHLSIDGATNETMKYLRGISLDMMIERLEAVRRLRAERPDVPFRLVVIFVVLERNIRELIPLIEILEPYGVDLLLVQHAAFGPRRDEIVQSSLLKHRELAREMFPRIRQAARRIGVPVQLPWYEWLDDAPAPPRPFGAPVGHCYSPWSEVYVDVAGNVKPCCLGAAEPLGNILDQSFTQIWNGPRARKLRRTVNSDNPPAYCRTCGVRQGHSPGNEQPLE